MLELGRACVQREHRDSMVLMLLWKGIFRYACETGTRYLVGCSSLTSQDPAEGQTI
jgi:putative hemolysin